MGIAQIATAVSVFLAGLVPASCHKTSPQPQTAVTTQVAAITDSTNPVTLMVVSNTIQHNLGDITLTNRAETVIQLGGGKDCILSPKVIDGRNVQITFALESRTQNGRIHDLSVAQIVTSSGKAVEIALGDFNLTLTPRIALE